VNARDSSVILSYSKPNCSSRESASATRLAHRSLWYHFHLRLCPSDLAACRDHNMPGACSYQRYSSVRIFERSPRSVLASVLPDHLSLPKARTGTVTKTVTAINNLKFIDGLAASDHLTLNQQANYSPRRPFRLSSPFRLAPGSGEPAGAFSCRPTRSSWRIFFTRRGIICCLGALLLNYAAEKPRDKS
jgi:hypothetical protein